MCTLLNLEKLLSPLQNIDQIIKLTKVAYFHATLTVKSGKYRIVKILQQALNPEQVFEFESNFTELERKPVTYHERKLRHHLEVQKAMSSFDDVNKVAFFRKISKIHNWPDSAGIFFCQDRHLTAKFVMNIPGTCNLAHVPCLAHAWSWK